jgi:amino acid transporter
LAENALTQPASPRLRRVLGRWDLVLLFVVAVTNLNVVPAVAAAGPGTLWLWMVALVFFFWPQGVAVIELAHRYPGEGGVYLWTKELFGDFHGFISGWCYWTNNIFYVPTVLFYLVGLSVYVGGERAASLADNRLFVLLFSLGLLWLMVALNVRGLGVGKWVNNLGGIGTAVGALALMSLAAVAFHTRGAHLPRGSFSLQGADWQLASTFGVICFALVGLELGSVMGDEIRDPRRTLPSAVIWGGVISGILYIGVTLVLSLALAGQKIGVVQGIIQAVSQLARDAGLAWIVSPLALVLSISTAGIASAWFVGSARIPFVAGLDRYLPPALGRVHPRFATPYVALITHAALSSLVMALSFAGVSVMEAYLTMLGLAVFLQLVPFLYMYAALVRLAAGGRLETAHYKKRTMAVAGGFGFLMTALGMVLSFVPSRMIKSVWVFELKMLLGCALFVVVAAGFFRVYAARKPRAQWTLADAETTAPGGLT